MFDCWMAPDGRWCRRTIVGPSDVARIMQVLEVDELLRVVAQRLAVSTSVVADLGRFRLRSRNQRTIPTPIPESESLSESFVVSFGGVGIGVGIVVIGIRTGSGWRFHTFMST